ncbi:membrane dipeptidase [Maricaulis sp.]|uniref:dipeptidase n=1 Tax=Maricaulis sp. TaxID=1486257 RepID=UPI001B01A629|nr:membrane dipeptidase [Maricaulis sp.]MBO6795536.1 membrane dipeptidase [Maricaulis sp.]
MRIILSALVVLVAAILIGVFRILPAHVDNDMNGVHPHAPYQVSAEARALHDELRVADLHSDMLLWMRNPRRWNNRGHTDLPRLAHSNVRLQVFASVTKTPSGQNYQSNSADSDNITALAVVQRWPVDTWNSLFARARFHARRLQRIERAGDELVIGRTSADLRAALANPDGPMVALLATEGAHSLEGEIDNLQRLHDEGYRVLGLHHFFDNELGGSLHGLAGDGLSAFGEQVVLQAVDMGMVIDVAHSSHQVVRDVLGLIDEPVIVSHTGIHGHCQTQRNLPDALMREIAAAGGLIGIGFWADVTCDDSPAGVARAITAAVQLVGIDHVALGSDYDGAITASFDGAELAVLTHELLRQGFSRDEVALIMGENAIRFFLANLPEGEGE